MSMRFTILTLSRGGSKRWRTIDVPQMLALKPTEGEGLTASVKAGELKEVKDELKNLSWIERTVAERFAKPFSYKHTSDYSITVPGQEGAEPVTIKGQADYTYQRLN